MNQSPYLSDPSSLTVQFPNSPPVQLGPACPIHLRFIIYYLLSISVPYLPLPSFHFISFPFLFTLETKTCYQSAIIDRSLISFLFFSFLTVILLDPKNHEDTAGKKHTSSRGLFLSLESSLRPSVRVKDSFLSIPFVRAYLGGHVRF